MEKKFFKITIMAIMLVLVYSTIVNALSFTATMTPSSTTVAESTEFTVTIKLSNLDVGTTGVNSFSAKLDYDTNVFETVNSSSFTGLNGWTMQSFAADSKIIVLTKLSFVKSEEEVFQMTLKTKEGVSGKTGNIKLTEVKAADPSNDIEASDVSTSIVVGTNSGNTTNTTTPPKIEANVNKATNNTSNNTVNKVSNNSIKNNTTNKVTNNVPNTVNKVKNTVTDDDIPYTGVEDTVIKAIFVVIAVALIFYIKFERINKEMK